jgi:hypothetical protein
MSRVMDRVKALFALAKIRPGEETNEARLNEARTSAFLLLKYCGENGVKIRFTETAATPKPVEQPQPRYATSASADVPFPGSGFYGFEDFIKRGGVQDMFEKFRREQERLDRQQAEEMRERSRKEASRRSYPDPWNGEFKVDFSYPGSDDDQVDASAFHYPQQPSSTRERRMMCPSGEIAKLIQAKFKARCQECGKMYPPGTRVWWVKDRGCTHEECGVEAFK